MDIKQFSITAFIANENAWTNLIGAIALLWSIGLQWEPGCWFGVLLILGKTARDILKIWKGVQS